MLWFKKQPSSGSLESEPEVIVAAALSVPLYDKHFEQKISALQHSVVDEGGMQVFIDALQAKHEFYASHLAPAALKGMNQETLELLLETVFSARRRVFDDVMSNGMEAVILAIEALLYGKAPLVERMQAFSMLVHVDESAHKSLRKQSEKTRRAALDFAAELLHFNAPERYPLMCRWVWDQNTVSGALREFIRGNDVMHDVPLGSDPSMFEGARQWMAEQLSAQGVYRDIHFWIDLVMAQAYTDYFRSMAEGMLSADFGRGNVPTEHIRKFLGIDAPAKDGASRIKKMSGGVESDSNTTAG